MKYNDVIKFKEDFSIFKRGDILVYYQHTNMYVKSSDNRYQITRELIEDSLLDKFIKNHEIL